MQSFVQIKKLEARIERQQRQIDHLEWHCYVYQATLQKVAEGMHIHAQSLQEFGKREQPVCPHCEREELLKKVADLEAKEAARGSATGSQSMETQL